MPTIDATQGVLVVRIVYDGPAMSGKTSSLRSLAEGVQSKLETGEEQDGRTLYFDWMEYVGGLFEGRQIRCQIISVPGQRELAARRKVLLDSADAVVCVLDTRQAELDYGLAWLRSLLPGCRAEQPPVGVVVQANKRDAPDAVAREDLRARIHEIAPIAIVESIATASDGIREAFVFAVRLALDRVRALAAAGKLENAAPAEGDAAALLASLQRAEQGIPREGAAPRLRPASQPPEVAAHFTAETPAVRPASPYVPPAPVPEVSADDDSPELPFVPDPAMPGGMIWPPVDGRALLHDVASVGLSPVRTLRGEWWGSAPGWRFHSSPRALYRNADRGRDALVAWARLHSSLATVLSPGRAVILADAGAGRTRLWQLVSVAPTLREHLDAALDEREPAAVAAGVLDVSNSLARAHEQLAQSSLPCTLWSVGELKGRVCFVGLLPMPDAAYAEPEVTLKGLLARELTRHLRRMRRTRVDYTAMVRELSALVEQSPPGSVGRQLGELVAALD